MPRLIYYNAIDCLITALLINIEVKPEAIEADYRVLSSEIVEPKIARLENGEKRKCSS